MRACFLDLPETVAPDYDGGSLLNLVVSLATGFGHARTTNFAATPCRQLPDISAAHQVVFLIIDGLGARDVAQRGAGSFMSEHSLGHLTSVFPSTTACAVTATLCGLAPSEHGLPGWYVRDERFGGIFAPLPMQRRDRQPMTGWWKMLRLFSYPSLFQRMKCASAMVTHEHIINSPFNMRHSRGVIQRYGYRTLDEMVDRIVTAVRNFGARGGFVHAYHADYDALAHAYGIGSTQCTEHFDRIDAALRQLAKQLSGTGTALVVSADHGFVDSPPDHQVCLNAYPDLIACLDGPLWGEHRVSFARVKPGLSARFVEGFSAALGNRFHLLPSAHLVDAGVFGPARKRHPRFMERVGDFTLMGKGVWSIHDRIEHERPHTMIGMHAGASADEMLIPLVMARC